MILSETPENFQDWAAVFRDISPLDTSFNGMEDMESWIGFSSNNASEKRYGSDPSGIKSGTVNDIINLDNEGNHKSDFQCYQRGQGTTVWKSPEEPSNKMATRDVAMANGARRAAGLLPPLGVEAFSTVRLSKPPHKHLSIDQFCTTSNACQMQIPATGSMPTYPLANATAPMNFKNFTATAQENKYSRLALPSKVVASTGSVHDSARGKPNRCATGSEENNRVPLSTDLLDANSVVSAVSRCTMSAEQCTSDFDFGSEEAPAFNTCIMSSEQCTSDFDIASKGAPPFNILAKGSHIGLKNMEQERYGCHKRKARDGESTAHSQNNDASQDSTSMGKRSRTAKVHNLSERRRRDRINEKMKALQELIPNCNKTDKASMLGEAIDYLKTLQSQMITMNQLMTTGVQPMAVPTNFGIGAGTMNSGYPILYNFPNQYGFPYIGPSSSLQFLAEAVNTTSMFKPNLPDHYASFSQGNPKTSGM